jgi:hypothetical protein
MNTPLTPSPILNTKCWNQGESIPPLQTLGAFIVLFVHQDSDGPVPLKHVLAFKGESKAYWELFGPTTDVRWVTCQQAAMDGTAESELAIGMFLKGQEVDLLVLFHPFLPAAQQSLAHWNNEGSAALVAMSANSGDKFHAYDIPAPLLTPDRIKLPIILAEAERDSYVLCMVALMAEVPNTIDISRTAVVFTSLEAKKWAPRPTKPQGKQQGKNSLRK